MSTGTSRVMASHRLEHRLVRRLSVLLTLALLLALASFPGAANAGNSQQDSGPTPTIITGRDAVSGVVRMDPHIYGRPAGQPLPTVPDVTNVNTTNQANAQNETTIAVNPLNPSVIVGGVNDYRPAGNNDVNCGFVRSSDGGLTWSSGILMGITRGNGGPFTYDAAGDPSVYYGADGTAYFACLGFDRSFARSALLLEKSTDGGVTWSTPTAIVQSNTINLFHDKEMLTIDTNPASPFFGRLYVEWAEFLNSLTTAQEVISFSSDGGATWSTPAVLSGSRTTVEGASPAVGPDGTVYASWCFSSQFCESNVASTIFVNKSTDGGVSWSAAVAAANFTGISSPLPGNLFRTNSFPTAAVNPVNGHVYIAFADSASGNADIKFARSTDGGVTWGAPIQVNSRRQDDQFFQWMRVAPNGLIWVCYYDQSWNTTNWLDMSCSRSNTGTSFSRAIRVTTQSSNPANDGFGGAFIGDYTGLGIGSNNVPHALWTDTRTGNADAFTFNR